MVQNPEYKDPNPMFKFDITHVNATGAASASKEVTAIAGYRAIALKGYAASGSVDAVLKMHALNLNVPAQVVRVDWTTAQSSPVGLEVQLVYAREDLL